MKSNEDMILALAGQFKQLSHEPEKFRWLNGIRTHDLCNVQCSHQLSYEVTQWRAGQFVGLMFSRERNVIWKNVIFYEVTQWRAGQFVGLMFSRERNVIWKNVILFFFSGSWDNCLNCPASARIISSFDFIHRTAYNILSYELNCHVSPPT